MLLIAFSVAPARAQSFDLPALFGTISDIDVSSSYVDASNGMNGTEQGWTAYGSVNIGLSAPLNEDGWRLKVFGHYSQYRYESREESICEKNDSSGGEYHPLIRAACKELQNPLSDGLSPETENQLNSAGLIAVDGNLSRLSQYQADRLHLGIAPGYAMTLGALTLKTYLGLAYQSESVTPEDSTRSTIGDIWGAEAIVESWLQLQDENWFSLNGSYFTGTGAYTAEFKYGHRPFEWLSAGPEFALYGDADDASARAGAFVRFYQDAIETTVSGGFDGTYRSDPAVYGSANVYMRF
jgi:hypothetical protein